VRFYILVMLNKSGIIRKYKSEFVKFHQNWKILFLFIHNTHIQYICDMLSCVWLIFYQTRQKCQPIKTGLLALWHLCLWRRLLLHFLMRTRGSTVLDMRRRTIIQSLLWMKNTTSITSSRGSRWGFMVKRYHDLNHYNKNININ